MRQCHTYNMKGVRKMAQINFRIDDELKEESKKIFDSLGIDLTTGIKIFLTKVVREKGIPFEMTVRKDNLAQALEEMKNEDYKSFDSVAELMKDLNDED